MIDLRVPLAASGPIYNRLLTLVNPTANASNLLKLQIVEEVFALPGLDHYLAQPLVHAHVLELKAFSKYVVLLQEIVGLRNNSLYKLFTLNYELFMLFSKLERSGIVPYSLELFFLESKLSNQLEYFLGISKSAMQPLCSVDHEEGDVSVDLFLVLKKSSIVNICHLSREVSNSKLAVTIQICQSRLLLPDFDILLEDGLEVANLVVGEYFDVALAEKKVKRIKYLRLKLLEEA
jgi:hypothetical protein